jgi:hypothetical protein
MLPNGEMQTNGNPELAEQCHGPAKFTAGANAAEEKPDKNRRDDVPDSASMSRGGI